MGQLLEGRWIDDAEVKKQKDDGSWTRTPSVVRHWIDKDAIDFPAEENRYHLYAAWNCPWAHRVLLVHALLGLEEVIPVSFVAPARTSEGWVFDPEAGYVDERLGSAALYQVYAAGQPTYTGRVTVPLLIDTKTGQLVSNESADIVRMLPRSFNAFARHPMDLYPSDFTVEIDKWNDAIHSKLNNGVYRAGFAKSQTAYDAAVEDVFEMLEAIEERLKDNPFLCGNTLTEADARLFPTLARFDVAYYLAFKCCRKRISDYPNIWRYARTFYAIPGVAETVKFDIYRQGYFSRSENRNPLGIVPIAPIIDWSLG